MNAMGMFYVLHTSAAPIPASSAFSTLGCFFGLGVSRAYLTMQIKHLVKERKCGKREERVKGVEGGEESKGEEKRRGKEKKREERG